MQTIEAIEKEIARILAKEEITPRDLDNVDILRNAINEIEHIK